MGAGPAVASEGQGVRQGVWLRSVSVLLFLAAVVLGWLAFTGFDGDGPPAVGSPGFREYEAKQMRDAQLSAGLGLATAFALLGAFACWQRATTRRPQPPEP